VTGSASAMTAATPSAVNTRRPARSTENVKVIVAYDEN
jgi:hypothetical protein